MPNVNVDPIALSGPVDPVDGQASVHNEVRAESRKVAGARSVNSKG